MNTKILIPQFLWSLRLSYILFYFFSSLCRNTVKQIRVFTSFYLFSARPQTATISSHLTKLTMIFWCQLIVCFISGSKQSSCANFGHYDSFNLNQPLLTIVISYSMNSLWKVISCKIACLQGWRGKEYWSCGCSADESVAWNVPVCSSNGGGVLKDTSRE